jgi:hypothetical protein
MGKWDALRETLPALKEDPTYEEALFAMSDAHRGKNIGALAEGYSDLKERKDTLKVEVAAIDLELAAIERVMLETLEAIDLDSVVTGGYRYTRSPAPYPKIEDRPALLAWVSETMPELLTVNAQTLGAVTKQRLEQGEALPPGVSVYLKETIARRKA